MPPVCPQLIGAVPPQLKTKDNVMLARHCETDCKASGQPLHIPNTSLLSVTNVRCAHLIHKKRSNCHMYAVTLNILYIFGLLFLSVF